MRVVSLSFKNLVRSRGTFALASVGVIVGCASFVFFVSVGAGVDRLVRDRIFPTLPPNQIEVSPNADAKREDGASAIEKLDERAAKRIAALPGVTRTYAKMAAELPIIGYVKDDEARAFFGRSVPIKLLIPAEGLDPAVLERDQGFVGRREAFRAPGGEAWRPIPAIVSTQLYEAYVEGAESLGVPVFPRERFIGFRFSVILGQGFGVRARRVESGEVQPAERMVEIVGFSRYAQLIGITFPIEVVRGLNRTFANPAAAEELKSLVVETATPESLLDVGAAAQALGFKRRGDKYAELVIQIVGGITLLFGMLAVVMLIIAATHIAHTFTSLSRERASEFAILRALGATRAFIASLVIVEALWVALLATLFGVALGCAGAYLAEAAVHAAAKPHALLATAPLYAATWSTIAIAAGLVCSTCIAGALIPAVRTAFRDPAIVLSS